MLIKMLDVITIFLVTICSSVGAFNSCGTVLPGVTRALINGADDDRDAPWAVSLGENDDAGFHKHFCTGIIIKGNIFWAKYE